MDKKNTIIYRVITGLFTANMLLGAGMYLFAHDIAASMFSSLGFPTYIIYPLAIAKILGLVAIWSNKSKMLKEWAYAGFTFELLLAVSAHLAVNDGEFAGAAVALVLVLISYFYNHKLYGGESK